MESLYLKEAAMTQAVNDVLTKTGKALSSLEAIAQEPRQPNRVNVDATIQRFELTIELFWKLLRRILHSLGREVTYPREILKEAYAGRLIDDEESWLQMLEDRNNTSHTYDEELADQIYENIKRYCPVMRETYTRLHQQFWEQ